jgi:hypothetical protein
MTKRIYLIKATNDGEFSHFKSQIFDKLIPELLQLNLEKLKVSITDLKRPRFSILPLKATGLAMISVWGEIEDCNKRIQEETSGYSESVAGYLVTESIPVSYDKTWDDGNPSPGAVLLTLMNKNAKLSYEQFMSEWFGHHTPMALRIHPLWNYIRNVVESKLIEDSPSFDGIVEEHFRNLGDITNPVRFFGGAFNMFPNMLKVWRHSNKFLDISVIENYLLREYHIRS